MVRRGVRRGTVVRTGVCRGTVVRGRVRSGGVLGPGVSVDAFPQMRADS